MATAGDKERWYAEALLVVAARDGDREAFAELVRRRQGWIRALMRRCCRDRDLADDLAQQAFLQAWRRMDQLRRPDLFGAWLKRLAISIWLQHLRKSDALSGADAVDAAEAEWPPDAGVAVDLDRALATLPDTMRLCVVLSYQEGMTHAEIADMTGLPPGTVKSHIRRGTQRLRSLLSDYRHSACPEEPS